MIENYKQTRKNTLHLNQDDYSYREVYESQYFLGLISLTDEILKEQDVPRTISKPYPLTINFQKLFFKPKLSYINHKIEKKINKSGVNTGNLKEIIENMFQDGKEVISLGSIVDKILELYSLNKPLSDNDKTPSKSNLLANYNKFLGVLGGKELFKAPKGLYYPKGYVPIVIFLLIMCSSKNNAFNMIINIKTKEKISYRSISISMSLLQKFLMKYSMFEGGKSEREKVQDAFFELFDYKNIRTFLKIKNRIEHLFNQMDKFHNKTSLTQEEVSHNQKYFKDLVLTTSTEKEEYLKNFEENILCKIDDFHNEIYRVLGAMKDKETINKKNEMLEKFYFLKSI